MKPSAVLTYVRVTCSVKANSGRPLETCVTPYVRKNVLFVIVLFVFLTTTLNSTARAQTSVVGFRTNDLIVIGSDGIARRRTGETKRFCKIHQIENVFFSAAAAISEDPVTGFSIWETATSAGKKGGTMAQKMKRFVAMVKPGLTSELEFIRRNDRKLYREQIAYGDKVVLQAMIGGFENNIPVLVIRDFSLLNPETSPVALTVDANDCPGNCNTQRSRAYMLGFKDHMEPYLQSLVAKGALDAYSLPDIARQMIASEIGQHPEVGPPITVLRITSTSADWVGDKGECPEIQNAQPKPALKPTKRRPRRT